MGLVPRLRLPRHLQHLHTIQTSCRQPLQVRRQPPILHRKARQEYDQRRAPVLVPPAGSLSRAPCDISSTWIIVFAKHFTHAMAVGTDSNTQRTLSVIKVFEDPHLHAPLSGIQVRQAKDLHAYAARYRTRGRTLCNATSTGRKGATQANNMQCTLCQHNIYHLSTISMNITPKGKPFQTSCVDPNFNHLL